MGKTFTVSIDIEVFDVPALYVQALKRAVLDGGPDFNPEGLLLHRGEIDIPACLQTLLDPGISPDGCDILESRCDGDGIF